MKNKTGLCAIFNYAPHYRLPIYIEMEKEFSCDFYFGDKIKSDIKKIDYSKIKGFKTELKNYNGRSFQLRKGVWKLAFKRQYKNYLISWEPLNVSLWLFVILCNLFGKKVYSWQHGISKKRVSKKFLLLDKFFLRLKAGTFLYGHTARNNMEALGFDKNKLFVIYNSLDYKSHLVYRGADKDIELYKKYFKNSDPTLLFIGRLTPVKKLDMVLRAQAELLKNNIQTNIVIIGDGELKKDLESLSESLKLTDRCWFTGALYDEEKISNYLYNADVCISPGNVGLTAMHTLSYGLPVITNDNFETQMPEYEAIKPGVSGAFFKENNQQSLVDEIKKWLVNSKQNREDIREECYKVIDEIYNPLNQIAILNQQIR